MPHLVLYISGDAGGKNAMIDAMYLPDRTDKKKCQDICSDNQ
jgi:hypothetical protein